MSSSACHDGPRNDDVDMTPSSSAANVAGAQAPNVTNTPAAAAPAAAAPAVAGGVDVEMDAMEAVSAGRDSTDALMVDAAPEMAPRPEPVAPVTTEEKTEKPAAPAPVGEPVVEEPAKACRPVTKKKKINPSKCGMCKKKIGLLGFKCDCGVFFCSAHRMAEAHNCQYDYKAVQRERLAQKNAPVLADKLVKI